MNDATLNLIVMDLMAHEGCENQMYLDARGNVTVGIGELLRTPVDAVRVPFLDYGGRPCAPAEIVAEFDRVTAVGQLDQHPYRASHYQIAPAVAFLPTAVCAARAENRVRSEFAPGIVDLLPRFSFFPSTVQRALIDMAWNLGTGGLAKFRKLLAACAAMDWAAAAGECHRSSCRESRNHWTQLLFAEAASEVRT